jgi:hypothetical protein
MYRLDCLILPKPLRSVKCVLQHFGKIGKKSDLANHQNTQFWRILLIQLRGLEDMHEEEEHYIQRLVRD